MEYIGNLIRLFIVAMVIALGIYAAAALAGCGGDAPPAENGAACETATDCTSGLCVSEFGDGVDVEAGLCTAACTWDETGADDCPDGEVCLQYTATGERYCFTDCATGDDCRTEDGWSCALLGGGITACIPPL